MEHGIVLMMIFPMTELFEDRSCHVPEVTWLVRDKRNTSMWFTVRQLHGLLGYRVSCDGRPAVLSHLGLQFPFWKVHLLAPQYGLPETLQGQACILHV